MPFARTRRGARRSEPLRRVGTSAPLPHLSDEDLLTRYVETRERSLFTELVRRYERELYNYLRRYLNDAEMAEDVFQATFLQVHLKCDQFEAGRRVRPWLYTIATHQAIDAQRRNNRHRMASLDGSSARNRSDQGGKLADVLVSVEPDPRQTVVSRERGEWVREAMNSLTEPMRQVVQLVYYQGLKYREAAEVLSVPVGTIKSRLHTAIARLAEIWNQSGESEPSEAGCVEGQSDMRGHE